MATAPAIPEKPACKHQVVQWSTKADGTALRVCLICDTDITEVDTRPKPW
jgi:hypothetical protein